MSEYEDARDRCREGSKKQTSIFQPEYDGGHNSRIGERSDGPTHETHSVPTPILSE